MLKPIPDPQRDHFAGNDFAPVTLVQYGDFQCAKCAQTYVEIKMLQEAMGNELKFVFRHCPNVKLHPLSLELAVITEVAALQGKFWYMHDLIFENQPYLTRAGLLAMAEEIEVDLTLFTNVAEYKKRSLKVISDYESSVRSGVNGTPTFFVNGLRYSGMHSFEGLQSVCKFALTKMATQHH